MAAGPRVRGSWMKQELASAFLAGVILLWMGALIIWHAGDREWSRRHLYAYILLVLALAFLVGLGLSGYVWRVVDH